MTTKHTPGPWQAVSRDILSLHAYPRASGPLVCVVDDNDNSRWPADANLIAAAPDLLAALEDIIGHCRGCDGRVRHYGPVPGNPGQYARNQPCIECRDAHAAIAKARGEP